VAAGSIRIDLQEGFDALAAPRASWREGGNFSVAREAAQIGDPRICRKSSFLVKTRVAGTLRFWGYPPFPTRGVGGQLLFALDGSAFIFGITLGQSP
jgi:hypothetical protein